MPDALNVFKSSLSYLETRGMRYVRLDTRAGREPEIMIEGGNETLDDIRTDLGDCKRCGLSRFRTNIVFGEGNPDADLMFIGEGPGEDEDLSGRPFVGKAGRLLTDIIAAMKTTRENVYIANIVKCRPPGNRTPMDDEVICCVPFLMRQISAISPRVIVSLGAPAASALFNKKVKISSVRGRFCDFAQGIKLMPTFHPAYLLRNPKDKRLVWEDMQKIMDYLKLR
ncbi:MAG: uracil-DNA glycosylase [Oligoflexia bacterium]|nr:uracil-DNA glycosylase [Oligoflexia bacterium]